MARCRRTWKGLEKSKNLLSRSLMLTSDIKLPENCQKIRTDMSGKLGKGKFKLDNAEEHSGAPIPIPKSARISEYLLNCIGGTVPIAYMNSIIEIVCTIFQFTRLIRRDKFDSPEWPLTGFCATGSY